MIFCEETKNPQTPPAVPDGEKEGEKTPLPEESPAETATESLTGTPEESSTESSTETPAESSEKELAEAQDALPSGDGEDARSEQAPGEEDVPDDAPEMAEVVGIRFRTTGKTYYFDPQGIVYPEGSHAVVETARGIEYGEVALTNRMVKASELVASLRPALRVSTPEDDARFEENRRKEKDALTLCAPLFENHEPPMKLIDAEYTFDNSKLLFYFTADGRVDFRELVRDLAAMFHCRIELRQMGIRDEAKALGGLGICGRPFCCHAFLPDFVQVSIKMAKEQSLSLNAAKISGACGRLMCCLRYEYDTYLEEGKRTPAVGSIVHTRDGDGVVVEAKPLTGMVKVRPLEDPDETPRIYPREEVFPGKGEPGKEKASDAPERETESGEGREREKERSKAAAKRAPRSGTAGKAVSEAAGTAGEGPKEAREGKAPGRSGTARRGQTENQAKENERPGKGRGGERGKGREAAPAMTAGTSDTPDGTPVARPAQTPKSTAGADIAPAEPSAAGGTPTEERVPRRKGRRPMRRDSGRESREGKGSDKAGDSAVSRGGAAGNEGKRPEKGEKSEKKPPKKASSAEQETPERESGKGYTVIPGGEGRTSRPPRRFRGKDARKRSGRDGGDSGES